MSSVCEDQHKFQLQPSHQLLSLKKSLRDIDIPPRKLLTGRAGAAAHGGVYMFSDETLLHKYLPHNKLADSGDSHSDDPYSSDHFRMYEFKVRRCTRSRSHDWTDCPFTHPGEKARRRDPRRYHYSGTVCPQYHRDGACCRGDACEFSHGVFECWLHPARYRTEACKDGKSCKRKVCFFAHTPRQLRVLPLNLNPHHVPSNDTVSFCDNHSKNNNNYKSEFCNNMISPSSNNKGSNSNHCCLICHCCSCSSNSTFSPTSTLFGMSHFSPPMSPSPATDNAHCGGVNHYNHHHRGVNVNNVGYKDVLTEILCSFEGLNFVEASSSPISATTTPSKGVQNNNVMPWLDVCFEDHQLQNNQFLVSPSSSSSSSSSSSGCEDHKQHNFSILSPTIVASAGSPGFSNGGFSGRNLFSDEGKAADDVSMTSFPAPDLGWVNELLM